MKLETDPSAETISNAFDFAMKVHELGKVPMDEASGALWFRGQANNEWKLKPSIGRSRKKGGLYDVYKWTITKDLIERINDWNNIVKKLTVKYPKETIDSKEIINQEKVIINEEAIIINPQEFSPEFEGNPKNHDSIEEYTLTEIFEEKDGHNILQILQENPKHMKEFYKEFYDHEKNLLQRFKRDAYPIVQRMLTDWEAITLGQHHGLPTRLLDWTSNPLVALFNAVNDEKNENKNGVIFAYRPRKNGRYHLSMFEGQNPENPDVLNPLTLGGSYFRTITKSQVESTASNWDDVSKEFIKNGWAEKINAETIRLTMNLNQKKDSMLKIFNDNPSEGNVFSKIWPVLEQTRISEPYIKVAFPMLVTNRLIAQSGGFTIQDPLTCIDKMGRENFEEKSLDVLKIYRWEVPWNAKQDILDQLLRVSINKKTLFPDLDGIGHGLWQQEQFRKSQTERP